MIKLLIENILKHPFDFKWSVQGLGQMRMYLSPKVRLHIWDRALLVPGVSAIHTHPWDFTSTVIAGIVHNRRFNEGSGDPYNRVRIECGENAHMTDDVQPTLLWTPGFETFRAGQDYSQRADEIHESTPEDGTITLIERTPKPDADHAFVYWRGKGGWVDAKPREATTEEIAAITARALTTWFT